MQAYLEPNQSSKKELPAKTINDFEPLTIFAKSSTLDVWLGSEWDSGLTIIFFIKCKNLSHFIPLEQLTKGGNFHISFFFLSSHVLLFVLQWGTKYFTIKRQIKYWKLSFFSTINCKIFSNFFANEELSTNKQEKY